MLNRFVNKVKLIMALALILLVFNTTAFAGEWTNTKENGSIINVVVLMKIKATTFIFLRTKKHDKFLIKY